jgi:hypothetical protein
MTNNDEGFVAVIAQAVEKLETMPVRDAEFEGAFTCSHHTIRFN